MTPEDRKIDEHNATETFIKAVITAVLILFAANILFHYHQRGDEIQRLKDRITYDSLSRLSEADTLKF